MCGIAGYNVSQEFAKKYLTTERQADVLEHAWSHNEHRGRHATGVFYLPLNEDKIKVQKNNIHATDMLDKGVHREIPVSTVMGAHTRAATVGDPKFNKNNHPVYWNNVWLTHNGMIHNHLMVKDYYVKEKNKKLPDVDTVAINLVLSQFSSPYPIKDIAESLNSDLNGSFAVHAVWRKHPGLSLLFKGARSPLFVAVNLKEEAVFYGSEIESVWHMINALGIDPSEKGVWTWREMDMDTAILVEDGMPIRWHHFGGHFWGSNNVGPEFISRLVPLKDGTFLTAFTTDRKFEYCVKNGALGRDANKVPDNKLTMIYSREYGFMDDNSKFPFTNISDTLAAFTEAELVIFNEVSDMFHVYVGDDIELIVSKHGTVKDIYDLSINPSISERWHVRKKASEGSDDGENAQDLDAFLTQRGSYVAQHRLPKEPKEPRIKELLRQEQEKEEAKKKRQSLPLASNGGKKGEATSKEKGERKGRFVKPNPSLTFDNIYNVTYEHSVYNDKIGHGFFFIVDDLECRAHDVKMVDHAEPWKCGHAKATAAYAWSCASDITILSARVPSLTLTYSLPPEKKACGHSNNRTHDWYIFTEGRVTMQNNNFFDIPLVEECIHCGAQRALDNIPNWLEGIMVKMVGGVAVGSR